MEWAKLFLLFASEPGMNDRQTNEYLGNKHCTLASFTIVVCEVCWTVLLVFLFLLSLLPPPQENVSLLKEINDLRTELKKSRTTAHDLEAVLKIARKQGFDEMAALASTAPHLPPTGLAKVEPPADSQRVIEIQRAEISRLRGLLREAENRPSSVIRLPPMQHSSPLPVV